MFTKSNVLISATTLALLGAAQAQDGWSAWQKYALDALISEKCQTAWVDTFSGDSALGQCQFYDALAGITDQTSLESYLNTMCGAQPCSDDTLKNAADAVWTGCSTELGYLGITQDVVNEAFGSYSLQREIACLKTNIDSNDRYCLSVLSQSLESSSTDLALVNYQNITEDQLIDIAQQHICNDCVFASVDLVEQQYPELATADLGEGKTLADYLDGVCADEELKVTTDGTLPAGITKTATGSTFPNTAGMLKRMLRRNIGGLKNRFFKMI
ncbi:uncharacterized protein I303_106128 [Kwoniella dejecticola CBS 10117]|uniref:Uncharacterized protein n=1 Tax=Kwoniella dejecticola CBS 10117 TaxID=1296121 RepID=A0A1A6A1D1_9TREE|nr:uncharacterized protein I303_06147 [Kwoniella dejecticola CBS 10117]OBR83864.1 hypothetical protein I303_06147 [Kwoniella dejecticola CBS 10117]